MLRSRLRDLLSRARARVARAVAGDLKIDRLRLAAGAEDTFGVYVEKWLVRRIAEGLRSEIDYRSQLDNHILPVFRDRPLAEVTTREIREFISGMRAKLKASGDPLAPRTVRNIYALLRNVFASALRDEIIQRNPCCLAGADIPKNIDSKADFRSKAKFDRSEVIALLEDESIPAEWRLLYRVLFFTGARVGEISALTWERVELAFQPLGKITIASSFSSKSKRVGATKTNIGREVPIHPQLAPMLLRWHEAGYRSYTGRDPQPSALVLPAMRNGEPKHRRNTVVLHRLHDDLESLGLRPRRTHDFRRTFITLACAENGADKEILRRVTHTRPGDVFNSYREVPWEVLCREMEKLRL